MSKVSGAGLGCGASSPQSKQAARSNKLLSPSFTALVKFTENRLGLLVTMPHLMPLLSKAANKAAMPGKNSGCWVYTDSYKSRYSKRMASNWLSSG